MTNFFKRRETAPQSEFSNLLSFVEGDGHEEGTGEFSYEQQVDAFTNAPIYTAAVDKFIHSITKRSSSLSPDSTSTISSSSSSSQAAASLATAKSKLIPQYGLIGIRQDTTEEDVSAEDRLVLANMNMPWSAFICGSQGAGKSHTLSCLLENALVANNAAGKLPHPLTGMVFHYDHYASYSSAQLCEQAYLCSSGIPVTVLVSPSNIWAMKRLYENLPGMKPGTPKPKVLPLYLDENRLDIQTILKLMAVDPTVKEPPLYMEIVMNIAREMAMEGVGFTYSEFRKRLSNVNWLRGQDTALNLRLQLIDTIIAPSEATKTTRPAQAQENIWSFDPGSLTIVDLSDPFFSSDDACTLFSICLSIFLEERHKCGRVVVLDEAHKFLGQSGEAQTLTDDLLSVIRQQRHLGTRVLIATQEPTLSPVLIDLANATFVHRFLSPRWYKVLEEHLAGASKHGPSDSAFLFNKIVSLRTGEALLFCPTGRLDIAEGSKEGEHTVMPLSDGYVKIKIRKRLTADGGKSIMATDALTHAPSHALVDEVPMHSVIPQQKNEKEHHVAKIATTKQQTEQKAQQQTEQRTQQQTQQQTEQQAKPQAKPQTNPAKGVTNNGQAAPKPLPANSNLSHPTPVPAARPPNVKLNRRLRVEIKKRAREMFEGNWSSFHPLTQGQIAQLCSNIDTAFKLQPGTTVQSSYSRGNILNEYLTRQKFKH
ncbi:hypothetical protein Hte_007926 [Hypoxylon texense]